jgi:ABC-type branched-subunit amino acid transport system ATPase component
VGKGAKRRAHHCCRARKGGHACAPIIVADIFRTIGELRTSGVSVLLVEQNAQAALKIATAPM